MTEIIIVPANACRCLWFTETGQQVGSPLPAGEYDMLPEMELQYSDLGARKTARAHPFIDTSTGIKYYVAAPVADALWAKYRR